MAASSSAAAGANTLEARILAFVSQCSEGASHDELEAKVPGAAADRGATVAALNSLLEQRLLTLARSAADQSLRYRAAGAREQRTKGLAPEELMVLQHIQRAGSSGVWTKDLKARTNLAQPQVTRVLKALESRGLTKAVKSVANPSRKLVMLAELEPSKEVTGGAWYTEAQQYDAEFIAAVRDALLRRIERAGTATLASLAEWIAASGVVRGAALAEDDVRQAVDSLVFEGLVEDIDGGDGAGGPVYRRTVARPPPTTALTELPCGRCPVMDQCREGGPISPQTCVYFAEWLDF